MVALATTPPPPLVRPRIYAWPRVRTALIASGVLTFLFVWGWKGAPLMLLFRMLLLGQVQVGVFGLLERWPRRLPRWLARWALQLVGVAAVVPFAMAIVYAFATLGDATPWYHDKDRMGGYAMFCFLGILVSPWIAMAALYRQISGQAQRQALAFELARSELERNAAQSRLSLLQAQVEPHFLFNTLANVRELVDSGSPQASVVLGHLIAYLRAAVPRLHEAATTVGQEVELARAYLEVMHMRMPDRLQFVLHVDDAALGLQCPPMTLLTLVENAVRHGIDPAEEGGRIEVRVRAQGGRCRIEVVDTGVGLAPDASTAGLGTGLANLRERLALAYGGDAQLRLAPMQPRGASAEIEFPARQAAA
jgi:signal transduction histidine kinase